MTIAATCTSASSVTVVAEADAKRIVSSTPGTSFTASSLTLQLPGVEKLPLTAPVHVYVPTARASYLSAPPSTESVPTALSGETTKPVVSV